MLIHGQIGDAARSLDRWHIHILRMPLVVEQDAALDPRDMGLFSAHGAVLES